MIRNAEFYVKSIQGFWVFYIVFLIVEKMKFI